MSEKSASAQVLHFSVQGFLCYFTIQLAFEKGSLFWTSDNGSFMELFPLFSAHYKNTIPTKGPLLSTSGHQTCHRMWIQWHVCGSYNPKKGERTAHIVWAPGLLPPPQQVTEAACHREVTTLFMWVLVPQPLAVWTVMILVLQIAYSHFVAFKSQPTTLSGAQWKKSWYSVLSLGKKITGKVGLIERCCVCILNFMAIKRIFKGNVHTQRFGLVLALWNITQRKQANEKT